MRRINASPFALALIVSMTIYPWTAHADQTLEVEGRVGGYIPEDEPSLEVSVGWSKSVWSVHLAYEFHRGFDALLADDDLITSWAALSAARIRVEYQAWSNGTISTRLGAMLGVADHRISVVRLFGSSTGRVVEVGVGASLRIHRESVRLGVFTTALYAHGSVQATGSMDRVDGFSVIAGLFFGGVPVSW